MTEAVFLEKRRGSKEQREGKRVGGRWTKGGRKG